MTLLSPMNIVIALGLLLALPALMIMMRPSDEHIVEYNDMVDEEHKAMKPMTVAEEAESLKLGNRICLMR